MIETVCARDITLLDVLEELEGQLRDDFMGALGADIRNCKLNCARCFSPYDVALVMFVSVDDFGGKVKQGFNMAVSSPSTDSCIKYK